MSHLQGGGTHELCDRMSLPPVFLPLILSALESKTSQFEIHYFIWMLVVFFFF